MKYNYFIRVFILAVFAIFQSCETEPLDSDVSQIDNNNPIIDEGETTGDYWPRAIGNMWNFDDSYYGDVTYHMVSTENIEGNTYYKFDQLFGQESWLRKSGDSYYIRTALEGYPIPGYDVTTSYLEIKLLADSALVGEHWSTDADYSISYIPNIEGYPEIPDLTFQATYDYEMVERDISRTVEGVEYNNVLHVKSTVSSQGTPDYVVHYYYAKDIGLVEFVGDSSSGTLQDYSLN